MTINNKLIIREVRDYMGITLGLLLYTLGWCVFLLPYEIVTGGVTGLSAIIFYATKFPIENSYLFINILLLLMALKVLGLKFMTKTIYAICMLYLMLKYAQILMTDPDTGRFYQILGPGQAFMSLVIGCSFTGTALAMVFLNNGSTGGTDIIAACVNKYYNLSLGQVLIIVDLCIIGCCMFIPEFGEPLQRIHKVVFGLCTMVIETRLRDERTPAECSVHGHLAQVSGNSQCHRHADGPRSYHTRRLWLVYRQRSKGVADTGSQAREREYAATDKDYRP